MWTTWLQKNFEIDLPPVDTGVVDVDLNLEEILKFDNDKEIANETAQQLISLQTVISSIEDFEDLQ